MMDFITYYNAAIQLLKVKTSNKTRKLFKIVKLVQVKQI